MSMPKGTPKATAKALPLELCQGQRGPKPELPSVHNVAEFSHLPNFLHSIAKTSIHLQHRARGLTMLSLVTSKDRSNNGDTNGCNVALILTKSNAHVEGLRQSEITWTTC